MKQNEGTVDRIIRIVVGIVILALYPLIGWWCLIGLIPLVTGITGYCGIYALFKISTKKK
jgi:hypothetical protein